MSSNGSSMSDLPSPIIIDILTRLPPKNVIQCSCVCKDWRTLLSGTYFANLHLSRSPTCLVVNDSGLSKDFKLVEIEDEPDHHDLHWDPVMRFDFVSRVYFVGSLNGLLCLSEIDRYETIYVCNPITREYVTLPKSKYERAYPSTVANAFGYSSVTGQYKVVRIYQLPIGHPLAPSSCVSQGEVYTLGRGAWRGVGHVPFFHTCRGTALSFNDRLHWVAFTAAFGADAKSLICIFDMDKELFHSIAPPPQSTWGGLISLGVLGGCLCVCDHTLETETAFWVMKDYGVNESWTKKFAIVKDPPYEAYELIRPLKLLKDGDILMAWFDQLLMSYNPKSRSLRKLNGCIPNIQDVGAMVHVPSFVSLRNFLMENFNFF